MPKFLLYAFFSGCTWIGFAIGYELGSKHMIHRMVDYTCEQIEDRKSYSMCELTVKSNMHKEAKK